LGGLKETFLSKERKDDDFKGVIIAYQAKLVNLIIIGVKQADILGLHLIGIPRCGDNLELKDMAPLGKDMRLMLMN